MAAWIRWRGGRLTYNSRIARAPFDVWMRTREGADTIAAAASEIRFALFGRHRAARRQSWRALANAATDESVVGVVQDEADRYLRHMCDLAYADGLPRVAVNLYRLVVVPRQLLNGVARQHLAVRLRREPAMTCLDTRLREFFCQQIVRDLDAAVSSARPSVKNPVDSGHGWMSVGLNTSYVWFAAVEDSQWAGHHFAFEVPREAMSRPMRKAVTQAIETFEKGLPVLSRVERNDILRRAWPAELLR